MKPNDSHKCETQLALFRQPNLAITTTEALENEPSGSVDPAASVREPHPSGDLRQMWISIRQHYFPAQPELDTYSLSWSYRNHRCTLASCNVDRRRILVAHLMRYPEAISFLEPLLFHEMCHAALGKPKRRGRRRILHGREFRALERQHPRIVELDGWIKAGGWHRLVRLYA